MMTNSIRPAAVAGLFYPRDPGELAAEVQELLDGVAPRAPHLAVPKALIVPHAGYIYSGAVAAAAYDTLAAARGVVRRVVALGPAHRVPVRGLALPGAGSFATPLGAVAVDQEAVRALADLPQVVASPAAHAEEHSLEVQLPFLQRMLGEFSLLPLVVGDASPDEVAAVIERLWGGSETLFVLSSDLSHYHGYDEAKRIDGATLQRITAGAADLRHEEACGATPLNGLLRAAQRRGLRTALLSASNSGDTAGGKGRVVGYGSFALHERDAITVDEAGRALVRIARAAIAQALGLPPGTAAPSLQWLAQPAATFVTLRLDGALRGCVGSLTPARPLREDVAANAVAAACRDPRFAPLTREAWGRCAVEVSLLTTPKPLRFADEADLLAQLHPALDGLILECDGRRGTFLPQVWEGLPEPRRFVAELLRKAGLPADTRLRRCKVWRYRVQKWTEEALQ